MKVGEVAVGVAAALSLPLYLSGTRLTRLMAEPPATDRVALDSAVALRVGLLCLRAAGRARLPGWRNSCLFRSVLRCRLLRRAGLPAVLKIGAARKDGESGELTMHAWVEILGEPLADEGAPFTELRGVRRPA